ncbi:MAG: nickel-type superoxide dismutase maturation protease [Microcystaceae cyanobacterium]
MTQISPIRACHLGDILLWLVRRRQRFQVEGVSMLPYLKPKDEVLVDKGAYQRSQPLVGDVVVVKSPFQPNFYLIKRIVSIRKDGACFLQGDNLAQSIDSRAFGWIARELIIGKVICRFF